MAGGLNAWVKAGAVLAPTIWQALDDAGLTAAQRWRRDGFGLYWVYSAHGGAWAASGWWRKPWFCGNCGQRLKLGISRGGKWEGYPRFWHPGSRERPREFVADESLAGVERSRLRRLGSVWCNRVAYDESEWGPDGSGVFESVEHRRARERRERVAAEARERQERRRKAEAERLAEMVCAGCGLVEGVGLTGWEGRWWCGACLRAEDEWRARLRAERAAEFLRRVGGAPGGGGAGDR